MGRADTGALQSMTGFARSQGEGHGSRWVWEIRSVNGKGLDVRFRVPPGLEQLEQPAREMVTARFARGNVQLALTLQRDESLARVQINRPVLDQLVAIADEVQRVEQIRIERANAGRRRGIAGRGRVLGDRASRGFTHRVELGEIRLGVETRVLDARDDERGIGKAGAWCVGRSDERRNEVFLHWVISTFTSDD